jgi:hypothetical protein
VQQLTLAVGSLDALRDALVNGVLGPFATNADVVVLPTAAAFVGAAQAAVTTAEVFDGFDVRVEALMVTDRASGLEPYFVERLADADLVVLCDGSPLHARMVWRNSPVGEAINLSHSIVAIGAATSVLGEVMIDPRGGAPMIGLGYRRGVAFCAPASEDQMVRTRSLLATDVALVVLGPRGILRCRDDEWRVVRSADVVVTRGSQVVTL